MAVWQLEKTTLLFYDVNVSESEPSLVFPLSHPGKFASHLTSSLGPHLPQGTINEMGMVSQDTTGRKHTTPLWRQ